MHLTFRNVNEALPALCFEVMSKGAEVPSRNGLTKELTHVHIELTHPWEREIWLHSRGHNPAAQIAETMWVLAGRNDVGFLEHYLPRAPQFSDDGKVWRAGYGSRLRHFGQFGTASGVDQLRFVVDLLKQDPETRRAVMSIWDPMNDTQPGKDIPCNNWLHFLPRDGKLDLHVAIRSNDLMWGWSGINHFEWSVLLEVVASLTGLEMGHLHFSISSLHLYERYWDKANRIAQEAPGQPMDDIQVRLGITDLEQLDRAINSWFAVEEILRLKRPPTLLEVSAFADPLLRRWLKIIQAYWLSKEPVIKPDLFIDRVIDLHNEKHAAYGDSWMKRGEVFSILPNIARKIDRLASGLDTSDEAQADTAIDLLVYLAKYRCWLTEHTTTTPRPDMVGEIAASSWVDTPDPANAVIRAVKPTDNPLDTLVIVIEGAFENLLREVEAQSNRRYANVDYMLRLASQLARSYA